MGDRPDNIEVPVATTKGVSADGVLIGLDEDCPAYEKGINYPYNDESDHSGVASASDCAILCSARGVGWFTYGTESPYTGRCWCKNQWVTATSMSSVTSGHACVKMADIMEAGRG